MEEIWKDIPDYFGYQVSNIGRIRTKNKTTYTKMHGIRHWKDRILKPKIAKRHTGNKKDERVELWKDGKHKTFLVSRLVATAFLGKSNLTVNHIDGNPLNNNINNLEFVSLKENIQKGFESGCFDKSVKKVKITNTKTNETTYHISLSKGSLFLGFNKGYLSSIIKKGIYQIKDYKIELL